MDRKTAKSRVPNNRSIHSPNQNCRHDGWGGLENFRTKDVNSKGVQRLRSSGDPKPIGNKVKNQT